MPRALVCVLPLLVLTMAGTFAVASPKPPTSEQMFYARHEVELEKQLANAQLKYTATHPRIVALQQEIDRCKQNTTPRALSQARHGKQTATQTLEQELSTKQEELYQLKLRFTEVHPRIKAAQQNVDAIKREIALRKRNW